MGGLRCEGGCRDDDDDDSWGDSGLQGDSRAYQPSEDQRLATHELLFKVGHRTSRGPTRSTTPTPFNRRQTARDPPPHGIRPRPMSTRLLSAVGVEKAFGDRHVLRGCNLTVDVGDRVGLVGPNGSGKSTLLRILAGIDGKDHGQVDRPGAAAYLSQHPVLPGNTVGDALDAAVAWHRKLLTDYEDATIKGILDSSGELHDRLDRVGWEVDHRVAAMADRLSCPPRDAPLQQLSGGEKRRIALARALLGAPDLILLDEPTNHLDADTIEWLQSWLVGWRGGLVLVTHDRYMLEAVATRITEVEDGRCVDYAGSYADYLTSRAERQARLSLTHDRHLALLAHEAEWASRSPAARSTKQKARLQRLDALKKVRPIKPQESFSLQLHTGATKGGPLLEVHGAHLSFDDKKILENVDLIVAAGDRIGIVGPNGTGKTTLLRIIQGEQELDRGQRLKAPRLKPAVLDQHRTGLDLDRTVFEAAGGGNSHVFVAERPIHVATLLDRFHFPRESHDQPASTLSGGERARLLMARLMLKGANLLLLDEPTNDLDLLTLRILEEALLDFDGAAVVVTHDRAFLDRVCNAVLAFEGDGVVVRYASRQQAIAAAEQRKKDSENHSEAARQARRAEAKARDAARASSQRPKKLSNKERREYDALPGRIEELEGELEGLHTQMSDPATWKDSSADDLARLTARAEALPAAIDLLYARWDTLEARADV